MITTLTTAEVADRLRCSPRKVRQEAKQLHLGVNLGGRAGFRYTPADVEALWEALRPIRPEVKRRKRRAA